MAQQLRGKGITLDKVLTPSDPKNRKTKVRSKAGEKAVDTDSHAIPSAPPTSHPAMHPFPPPTLFISRVDCVHHGPCLLGCGEAVGAHRCRLERVPLEL